MCGLALDFCVAYTAKDAKLAGFNTFLVSDASKPITQAAGAAAIESLAKQGVHIVITDTVPTKAGPP